VIRIASIAAALAMAAVPAFAQDAAAPAGPQTPDALRLPLIEGVTASPDCGGLYNLAGRAQCMTAPLSRIGEAAEVYTGALLQTGWNGVGGGPNQVLFQRPSEDGCDVLEMITFYDFDLPEDQLATAPGYIAFAMNLDAPCMQRAEEAAPSE
jgi:hypothetical protein